MSDNDAEDLMSDNEVYCKCKLMVLFKSIESFNLIYVVAVMTPVNEYKISDKIQSANNLLFASEAEESAMSASKMDEFKRNRVTFSSDIEEYDDDEPIIIIDEIDDSSHEIDDEIEEIVDGDDQSALTEIEVECERIENEMAIVDTPKSGIIAEATSQETFDVEETMSQSVTIKSVDEKKVVDAKKSSKAIVAPKQKSDPKLRAQQQHHLLKIHLNVRKCCESKYLDNDRLPRYNGYISQYGLSKDQLDDLEKHRISKQQQTNEQRKRGREAVAQKSAENEKAFTKWLRNKQKTAKPRTKNMYDVK